MTERAEGLLAGGESGRGGTFVDESSGGESRPGEPAPVASGLPEGGTTQPTGGDEATNNDETEEK